MKKRMVLACALVLAFGLSANAASAHKKRGPAPKTHASESTDKPVEKPVTRLPVPVDAFRA